MINHNVHIHSPLLYPNVSRICRTTCANIQFVLQLLICSPKRWSARGLAVLAGVPCIIQVDFLFHFSSADSRCLFYIYLFYFYTNMYSHLSIVSIPGTRQSPRYTGGDSYSQSSFRYFMNNTRDIDSFFSQRALIKGWTRWIEMDYLCSIIIHSYQVYLIRQFIHNLNPNKLSFIRVGRVPGTYTKKLLERNSDIL